MKVSQRKAGVVLSYTSEAVKILTGLVYTPVMLRLLGQSEYGLYQLVNSVVSYLGLLSLGFGSAYIRYYSRYRVKDDEVGLAKINGMFMVIFLVIAGICLICGGIMLGNIEGVFGTGLTEHEIETARALMVLMVINLAVSFPNSVFSSYLTAQERFTVQKGLVLMQNLLNPFLTLPLLIMGYGSIGMVVVSSILTFLVFFLNMFFCIKKLNMKFIFKGFSFSLLKEMWVFTFFIFLNQIIDQINWNVDKFLLGRYLGTTAVAVYGVAGQINTMYLQFSSTISNVFIPKVNKIVAETDDNFELTKLFTQIGRIQFVILSLVLSGFVFFGRYFVIFWAGEEYIESFYITLLLIAPATVPFIQNIGIEIQRAKNKHKTRSVVYFLIAVINVCVSIPLIKIYGAIGAAIGTAISFLLGNILFMNWYYHNRIGLDIIFFWKNIFSFIKALIVPVIVGCVMLKYIRFSNIVMLAVGIIGYTIVFCVSMWLWGLNEQEKQMLLKPIQKVLKYR